MARITVEDCLDNVENRFDLVMIASKRARQLQTGGKDPLVNEDNDKPTVLALREIAEGLIDKSILTAIPEEETEEATPETAEAAESEVGAEAVEGEETAENAKAATKNSDISIEEAMDAVLIPDETAEDAPPADADSEEDDQ